MANNIAQSSTDNNFPLLSSEYVRRLTTRTLICPTLVISNYCKLHHLKFENDHLQSHYHCGFQQQRL